MDRMGRGQSGSEVTKVPIDENKIRRGGTEGWGDKGGSREMRVFVFKEEIGWPGIFLACAITVVSVATIAQKYKGPLWGWEVIAGYRLLGYVCIRKKKKGRQNTTAQVPSLLNGCSSMKGRREEGGEDGRQSGCVSESVCVYPRLFIQSLIGLSFILLQPRWEQ